MEAVLSKMAAVDDGTRAATRPGELAAEVESIYKTAAAARPTCSS